MHVTSMDGSTISLLSLIKGLKEKGVECYVAYPGKRTNYNFESKFAPYVKKCYPANIQTSIRAGTLYRKKGLKRAINKVICGLQPLSNYLEYLDLKKIVREVKPDIIHSNSGVIQGGYSISKKLRIHHVWHLREYQDRDFLFHFVPSKKQFIKDLHDSYVITITKDILEYFNLRDSSKARCIYDGCLSKSEVNLSLPKEKYFFCSTRIDPAKGHVETIEAFSQFHKKYPEYKLLIAGEGPQDYVRKLQELSKKLKCAEAVKFLGFQKDVRNLMDRAMALIVASRFEGFGRMTAEAAFRGCMVIGKNTGGTKEILGQIGDFSYNGNSQELESAMEKVAKMSEAKYSDIVKKAQSIAVERFSNEQNVEYTYDFYKEIVNADCENVL
ncbi:hypothetical protein BTI56_02705 [Lactobacillus delbrueckii subsp. bulgaricus]|nr:hypothetical protein [Lactobacillus delbrueckii subsp. bulgaricus]